MAQKDAKTIRAELAKPFAPEDLEWRIQYADEKKNRGIVVPYVTNRAIQSRLDDVVGPENWYNDFKPWHGANKKEAQICGISIYFEERGQFITKWDGAEDSDIEPVKGGLSDSMKRAAVQWGVGRVLYSMTEPVWVNIEPRGRSWVIKKGERPTMDKAYLALLDKLKLQPAAPIGTQSELTPRQTEDNTGGKGSPAPAAGQEKPNPQLRQKPAPAYDCIVRAAMLQPGMTGSNTVVSLEYPDKKTVNAYARGEHPELVSGARLTGVKLAHRQQDTVVFYILEAYQVVGVQQAA